VRIIVGAVTSLPPYCPGMIWNRMQYALGFRELGHDVYFVEQVEPDWCVDSSGHHCRLQDSVNRRWFDAIMDEFGFTGRACQLYRSGEATSGMSLDALAAVCRDGDLLLNIAGHVKADVVLGNVRRRAYLDQDPVYTQLWRAEYGHDVNLDAHDTFFTVGLNIGTAHTDIPTCGLTWHHTLPPVVMNDRPAPANGAADGGRFTTIASWKSFGDICYRGEWYYSKDAEFRRFAALPARVDQEFEVALRRNDPADEGVRLLRANGWVVTASSRFTDLAVYRDHIAGSRAEIGIAKNAYVRGRSGWFSDRTADYLAHGRPALVQATGFERHLPTGQGLLTFDSMDEAVDGVERINRDYTAHCRAARNIAEEFLDSRKVLPKLLEDCAV
jgi:hypothetical protein